MGKVRSRVLPSSRNGLLSPGVLLLCLKSFSDLIGRKRARRRGPPRLAHWMRVKRISESSATPSLKSTACAPASDRRRSTNGRGRIKTFARVGQTWGVARNESLQARLPASAPNRGCLGSAESRWIRDCRNVHRRPRSPVYAPSNARREVIRRDRPTVFALHRLVVSKQPQPSRSKPGAK